MLVVYTASIFHNQIIMYVNLSTSSYVYIIESAFSKHKEVMI